MWHPIIPDNLCGVISLLPSRGHLSTPLSILPPNPSVKHPSPSVEMADLSPVVVHSLDSDSESTMTDRLLLLEREGESHRILPSSRLDASEDEGLCNGGGQEELLEELKRRFLSGVPAALLMTAEPAGGSEPRVACMTFSFGSLISIVMVLIRNPRNTRI